MSIELRALSIEDMRAWVRDNAQWCRGEVSTACVVSCPHTLNCSIYDRHLHGKIPPSAINNIEKALADALGAFENNNAIDWNVIEEAIKNDIPKLKQLVEAAKLYDQTMSQMEKERGRPDMYFTQHSTLTNVREIARRL